MRDLLIKMIYLFSACFILLAIAVVYESKTRISQSVSIDSRSENLFDCGNKEVDSRESIDVFKNNCAACHKLDKQLVGPMLNGILSKSKNIEWIKGFITNEDSLVKAKDSLILNRKGIKRLDNFSHSFSHLTEEELNLLLDLMR